jgi:D-tyrosyl-tRNA(Tyr) deacylase
VRAVVQRVTRAQVTVEDRVVGKIGPGVLLLVGISHDDDRDDSRWLADKVANLRILSDAQGRMNRSLLESGGEALVVSQFTLLGDARKGRRPSFIHAAQGADANELYLEVAERLGGLGIRCSTGEFGAMMDVELVNEGPVTILLDSKRAF